MRGIRTTPLKLVKAAGSKIVIDQSGFNKPAMRRYRTMESSRDVTR